MDLEERIERLEEIQRRVREGIEIIREINLEVGGVTTEGLIKDQERWVATYEQLIADLRKRLA